MIRTRRAASRDVISRAKDELVTPDEYLAFAHGMREAFELTYGVGEFEKARSIGFASATRLGSLWQVQVVRRELSGQGVDAAEKHRQPRVAPRRCRAPVKRCGGTS